ncbi:MAG: monoamine oxidase [Mycobacterium sp.]|nr:monoamine oxidase [Mycobacterium sp.]
MDIDREAVLPVMLAPAAAYRELLYRPDGEFSEWIRRRFDVVALPGRPLTESPRVGDVLLRVALGTPGVGECRVLAGEPLIRRRRRGLDAGWYGTIAGSQARRRITDLRRRVLQGQMILRPHPHNYFASPDEPESEVEIAELTCSLFAGDAELRQVLAGRLRLGARGTPDRPAPVRSQGAAVEKVQRALIAVGYDLPSGADGTFGAETGRAVVQFKNSRGIKPNDPVVGPQTIRALDEACRSKSSPAGYRIAASGRNTGQSGHPLSPASLPPLTAEDEPSRREVKVAVVGGGFAGLMAASSLTSDRFKPTLFEARADLGGRVRTDRSMIKGQIVEAGAELIGENHATWIMLAKKYKLNLERISTDDDYARMRPKLKTRVILGGHELTPKELKAVEAKLNKVLTLMGDEAKTVPRLQPWTATSAAKWDAMSVSDRLDQADMFGKQSHLARQYLEFTIENDNCVAVDKHSYLALLAAISAGRMGNDMLGYWTHTETHRCAGGNDQLATHLAKGIKDIRLNTPVESITLSETARVTYRRPDGPHGEDFDYVILAGPPTTWPRISSTPAFDPAKYTVSHGPAVKFISTFATTFWKKHGLAPVTKSDDVGSIWEATDKQPKPKGFGLSVYSGGKYVLDANTYSNRLDKLYPDYLKNRLTAQLIDWPNEPFIKAGYAAPRIGEVTTIMKNLNGSFQDRIFFAGEQVSPGFFGYMEGALQSGLFAMYKVVAAARRTWPAEGDVAEAPELVGAGDTVASGEF